jgi:hypothetical protein
MIEEINNKFDDFIPYRYLRYNILCRVPMNFSKNNIGSYGQNLQKYNLSRRTNFSVRIGKIVRQPIPRKIRKNYKELYLTEKKRNNCLESIIERKINELLKLELDLRQKDVKLELDLRQKEHMTHLPITYKYYCNDEEFWKGLTMNDLNMLKKPIEYLLEQFGTGEPCNRFDVGNSIEFLIGDYLRVCGFKVLQLPNTRRFDLDIENYKKLSVKYSSSGDITLHNSNSSINKDLVMKDTMLLTPDKLYLITNDELCRHNININEYIQNKGDSLKLKRAILKVLQGQNYPYIYDMNIIHDKKKCKNRLCSRIFYSKFFEEYSCMSNLIDY